MRLLEQLGLSYSFEPYGLAHAVVTAATVGAAAVLVWARRRVADEPARAARFDRWLAIACMTIFTVVLVRGLLPGRFDWHRSLPLHVCDVVLAAAVVAFWTGSRGARAVLHFIGLILSTQAYLTPELTHGPASAKFYLSWTFHGMIVVAAAVDVLGRGYRPAWDDWWTALKVVAAYVAVVFPLNAAFGWNYGYIGPADPSTEARLAALGLFGPWPQRVPLILAALALVMTLVTAAWTLVRRRQQSPARRQGRKSRRLQLSLPPSSVAGRHQAA